MEYDSIDDEDVVSQATSDNETEVSEPPPRCEDYKDSVKGHRSIFFYSEELNYFDQAISDAKLDLPEFSTNYALYQKDAPKSHFAIIREARCWVRFWGVEFNEHRFKEYDNFYCLRDLLRKFQYWHSAGKPPMTTRIFTSMAEYAINAKNWNMTIEAHTNRIQKLLETVRFDALGSPAEVKNLRKFFNILGIIRLGDDRLIKAWYGWAVHEWLAVTKYDGRDSNHDASLNPFVHIYENAKNGFYDSLSEDEFVIALSKIARRDDPMFHCDGYVRTGWPGFDNFRAEVLHIISLFHKNVTLDDPRVAQNEGFLSIIRVIVPTPIWCNATADGCPESLSELVSSVEAQKYHHLFYGVDLKKSYEIHERAGIIVTPCEPRTRPLLEEDSRQPSPRYNLHTTLLQNYEPVSDEPNDASECEGSPADHVPTGPNPKNRNKRRYHGKAKNSNCNGNNNPSNSNSDDGSRQQQQLQQQYVKSRKKFKKSKCAQN